MGEVIHLKPLNIAVVQRPRFENSNLHDLSQWCVDNSRELAAYFHRQGNALGMSEMDNEEFDIWLKCQWDIERCRGRLPHGDSL